MKAIVCKKYGPIDDLKLEEIPKPTPGAHEVLVAVYGSSINFNSRAHVTGIPFLARLELGFREPKHRIPGNDIAGRVEAVGSDVREFKPGDEVFGDLCQCGWGGFAQYVCAHKNSLTLKPANISFAEAAAVPEAAMVALQALRDKGHIQSGQKVLLHGASGGIGTFAVQIAKAFGAEVTGVCSTRNIDLVRAIGADHIIDYTQEDFTRSGQRYDLIVATAGYRSILDYKRVLNPKGIYVATGGAMAQIFQALLLGPFISMGGSKKLSSLILKPNKDLVLIKEMIEAGKVKPIIDKTYPLNQLVEALRYYGTGQARGKVVITIEHTNNP